MPEQPAVAYFGESAKAKFPLLLFFGREYNNKMENEVRPKSLGPYSFLESPKSAFWNKTYGFIGRICALPDFKKICIRENKSPVLFSNMLPQPIPASMPEKRQQRQNKNSDDKIREHIEGIFETEVINRVRLVLLSDIRKPKFDLAAQLIENKCKQRRIEVSVLPYLGCQGLKKEEMEYSLSEVARSIIKGTIAAFIDEDRGHTN